MAKFVTNVPMLDMYSSTARLSDDMPCDKLDF